MSDDVKHLEDELGLDTPSTTEDDVSTDAEATASPNADESQASSSEDKERKKEEAKAAFIASFGSKILSGELTYEQIPQAQQWMIPDIIAYVQSAKGTPKPEEKKGMTIEQQVKLTLLKDKLKSSDVPAEQLEAFKKKYAFYRMQGMDEYQAFQESLEFNRIELDKVATAPTTPKVGSGPAPVKKDVTIDDVSIEELNKMTPAQLKALKK